MGRNNTIVRIEPTINRKFSNNCETTFCDDLSGREIPKIAIIRNQYRNLAKNVIHVLEISFFSKASMMRKNLFVSIVALK